MKLDLEYLNECINKSNYSINDIYAELGISRISFWKKRKEQRPFKIDEILKLCSFLNLNITYVFIKE
ncbi:hypothetical protein KD33_07875 [Clostridium sp. NCR]|nr:hypothetical protein KD33_07875 [Clostridium sp. NCR]